LQPSLFIEEIQEQREHQAEEHGSHERKIEREIAFAKVKVAGEFPQPRKRFGKVKHTAETEQHETGNDQNTSEVLHFYCPQYTRMKNFCDTSLQSINAQKNL